MKRLLSEEIAQKVGEQVTVAGWIYNVRDIGKLVFLILRDRKGLIQIVLDTKEEIQKIKDLKEGSVIYATGEVKKTDATDIGVEIINPKLEVHVAITETSPIVYNKKSLDLNVDTELDYRPLAIRNIQKQAIFKVQAGVLKAFADSMRRQGFTEFRSPVLMAAPSESGADVFEVNYFEGKAYLAQSPQVYKQIMVGAFERAFTIATVFRAEKHNTTRHLMEITQLDGEMGFIDSYDDALFVVENVVRDIVNELKTNYSKELEMWNVELPTIPEGRFPKIKVREALKKIEERTGKSAERDELDLDPEDEREIGKWALEEGNSSFVWLLNFKKNKNFYTYNDSENPDESLSYDLVFRGLELLSGTHRIHEFDLLLKRFKDQGLSEEYYEHYLQAFKYGIPQEAGFSFGLERFTQQLFGLKNIREATLFPSDLKRIAGAKRHIEIVKSGEDMFKAISKIFDTRHIKYEVVEHESTDSSEQASEFRGTTMEEGRKALILVGKKTKQNYMVVVPANKNLDKEKIKNEIGEAFEFEKKELLKEKFGIELGGIPPFGNLMGMRVLLDKDVANTERSAFNAGLKTKSIIMKTSDFIEVLDTTLGEYSA